jgi:hypothetical protein
MRIEYMDGRGEGALAVVVSLQKFMLVPPLPPAPPIPAHAKTSPQKGDISNEVRMGTFLTRFDMRQSRALTTFPSSERLLTLEEV